MLPNLVQSLAWTLAAQKHSDFFSSRSAVAHWFQGSRAIADPEVLETVHEILQHTCVPDPDALPEFKSTCTKWLTDHCTNSIKGLENFSVNFSAGTSQAFDHFYLRHRQRRFRVLTGEYFYHLRSWISNDLPWCFIDDANPLTENDALVISVPFCDTGSMHPEWPHILTACDKMGIPVLVDCCYWGISHDVDIDLNHPCIDTVAFSLSKSMPVAGLRIGMRYVRSDIHDGQQIYDRINYNNQLSARVAVGIMQNFTCDHMVDKYIHRYAEICRYLDLVPGQSVIFALGDERWRQYNRSLLLKEFDLDFDADMFANRICVTSLLEQWDIFQQVINEN